MKSIIYLFKTMNQLSEPVIGIPINAAKFAFDAPNGLVLEHANEYHTEGHVISRGTKLRKIVDNYLQRVREHVRLGQKISETLKGKINFGARIIRGGGVEKVYKQLFSCAKEEKLKNASQCYLSTTTGPIAGILFVSTDNISFCSERSLKIITSPKGDFIRARYKVMIPLKKLMRVNQTENSSESSRKYIEIVTKDNFEFWFMGFLNYRKPLRFLQQAIFLLASSES